MLMRYELRESDLLAKWEQKWESSGTSKEEGKEGKKKKEKNNNNTRLPAKFSESL